MFALIQWVCNDTLAICLPEGKTIFLPIDFEGRPEVVNGELIPIENCSDYHKAAESASKKLYQ